MKENLTKQSFKGFFWQFGGAIFQSFIQLGVLFVLARLISKADFGIVQSALIVVGFAKLLTQMGIGPALIQKANLTILHIRAGVTLTLILSFVFFAVVFLSSGLIANFFKMPDLQNVLKVVSVLFIMEGITTVSQSLLLRDMNQKVLVQIDFISYLIGYGIVAIALSYYGYGLWSLIFGQLMQSFLKSVLSYWKSKHSIKPYWGKEEIRELLYFGGGFTIAKFFNYFANQGDNIITGRFLGADALGVYSRAYAIMVAPVSLIGTSLDKVLFPAMSARQNQPDRLVEAFIIGSKLITFLCIPVSCIIIFSSSEIVNVMLGSKWNDAIIPLQILTSGLIFRMGYKMGDCLSRATGNVYRRAKRQFIYALSMFVGCYIGSKWGIIGVSLGTLFAIILNYILMIHLSLVILKLKWIYFLKRTFEELPISLLLSLLFIIIIHLTRLLILSDMLTLIISYGTYGGILMILFYNYSHKLSFMEIIPFKETLQKLTKRRL
jgi:O-antigen/teichoic acid export membrane protein